MTPSLIPLDFLASSSLSLFIFIFIFIFFFYFFFSYSFLCPPILTWPCRMETNQLPIVSNDNATNPVVDSTSAMGICVCRSS